MSLQRKIVVIAAVLGGLSVAIGAFGAHALKETLLLNQRTDTFETAVRYQFYHALALLILGNSVLSIPAKRLQIIAALFVVGIVIFSGSLYVLCLTGIRWLGAITPLGGTAFIIGWIIWAVSAAQKSEQQ
ncbi:Uncharacterized membrane protein YgdD, TMEM256/DUF423 family [Flexibacter flexilis DSM 6793]|uniref:Uncharacterized membrane protein YgdD, TMEM256/DUF423 family n=1 Tax=Flexibacter flexilis DSM 6793 TaxID=927664 RepID=A0A1I1H1G6_9BACT|nr:DUF423 domain-containing protein [Flexibacter flexilis]SFC17596.1 Uncharacterized membrane protein YgdD, TMEM256/DUF423 family [Flexibacter flexilis DSM 6793]